MLFYNVENFIFYLSYVEIAENRLKNGPYHNTVMLYLYIAVMVGEWDFICSTLVDLPKTIGVNF